MSAGAIAVAAGAAGFVSLHGYSMFSVRSPLLGPRVWRLPEQPGPSLTLTFDDGPHPEATPRLLDLLDGHGVRASFFFIGRCVERHPGIAREVHRRGHAIGNHSHTHRHGGVMRGRAYWTREIERTQRAIEDAVGRPPTWFRPPLGQRSVRQALAVRRAGLRTIGWSCRSLDSVDRDPESIVRRIRRRLTGRDIVLMHDGVDPWMDRDWRVSVEAVRRLLPGLAEDGRRVIALDEALAVPPAA